MSASPYKARILQSVWVVALCTAVPAFAQEKGGGVTMDEHHIVVHPMTKISPEDARAINNVLKQYDKSFYKLDTYKDGHLKNTQGTLSDVNLDRAIATELTAAQAKGESITTMQFTNPQRAPGSTVNPEHAPGSTVNPERAPGSTVNPEHAPGSTVNPERAPGNTVNPQHAARELIERLKPILEKYSRK